MQQRQHYFSYYKQGRQAALRTVKLQLAEWDLDVNHLINYFINSYCIFW